MDKTIGFYKGHRAVMGDSIAKMVFQIRCGREKIDLPHTDETHEPLRTGDAESCEHWTRHAPKCRRNPDFLLTPRSTSRSRNSFSER